MNRRFQLILLVYSPERLASFIRFVRKLCQLADIGSIVVVINGDKIQSEDVNLDAAIRGGLLVHHHDNQGLEFGGYQAGLNLVRREITDGVIILNDTIGTHQFVGPLFLRAFAKLIMTTPETNYAAGMISGKPRRVAIEGIGTSRWIRSNLIAIDAAAIGNLDHRIYDPTINMLVHDTADQQHFFDDRMDPALKDLLIDWLFNKGQNSWYGAEPLTIHNKDLMLGKARSVLQEFHLSMRIENAGGALVQPDMSALHRAADRLCSKLYGF